MSILVHVAFSRPFERFQVSRVVGSSVTEEMALGNKNAFPVRYKPATEEISAARNGARDLRVINPGSTNLTVGSGLF